MPDKSEMQITKDLKLGETVTIDGKEYKLVESGKLDGRTHKPLVTLKVL